MFCDKNYWEARQEDSVSLEEEAEKYLRLNNLALENAPEDLVITTHVCRGNYHSTWHPPADMNRSRRFFLPMKMYLPIIWNLMMNAPEDLNHSALFSDDKKVVLGLVTSKSPILEEKEVIKKRIAKAAKYIPLDRLYLSPQCGFASCEIGNKLTEEEQWAKLALVKEIAKEVWGKKKYSSFLSKKQFLILLE